MNEGEQQLLNLAAIDEHIALIRNVLAGGYLPENKKVCIENAVHMIEQRYSASELKMAVVGEFSTGKSTFINALLRAPLLEEDILQGTTVAAANIVYHSGYQLKVRRRKGAALDRKAASVKELSTLLKKQVETTALAQDVRSMEIGYPSSLLHNGLSIMDTPGIASLSSWHQRVTQDAIREQADGCIVLTSALRPMSETLIDFLKQNLEGMFSCCAFIVTQIDLLPAKERPKIMAYIRLVIEREFGVSDPLVLPYTAYAQLKAQNKGFLPEFNPSAEELTQYVDICTDTEGALFSFLRQQRPKILLQRYMALLDDAMGALSADMSEAFAQHQAQSDELHKATKEDLPAFICKWAGSVTSQYNDITSLFWRRLYETLDQKRSELSEAILKEYNGFTEETKMQAFLKSGLRIELLNAGETLVDVYQNSIVSVADHTTISQAIYDSAKVQMESFENAFTKQYEVLKRLVGHDMEYYDLLSESKVVGRLNHSAQTALESCAQQNEHLLNVRMAGGAAAGAAAGAVIGSVIPVIGTVTGGIVGGLIGLMRGSGKEAERVSEMRSKTEANVKAMISTYFETTLANLNADYSMHINTYLEGLTDNLKKYEKTYSSEICRMRKQEKEEANQLEARSREITELISRINAQREYVKSLKMQMELVNL